MPNGWSSSCHDCGAECRAAGHTNPDDRNTLINDLNISSYTTSENKFLVSVGPWSWRKINGDRFRALIHFFSTLDPAKINTKHNAVTIFPLQDAVKSVLSYTLVNEQR